MNKKCFIITAYIDGFDGAAFFHNKVKNEMETAFVICADGGYEYAKMLDIIPNLLIGDFDSYKGNLPSDEDANKMGIEIYKVNAVKDDTDTGLCIKYALERGFGDITIIGGVGGRLSHTVANLQLLADTSTKVDKIVMIDPFRIIQTICGPQKITIKKSDIGIKEGHSFISILSHCDTAKGISIDGAFYNLENVDISNIFPLGVSNEFVEDSMDIVVEEGILHIIIDF